MTLKAESKSLTENSCKPAFRRVGGVAASGGFVSYLGDVDEGEAFFCFPFKQPALKTRRSITSLIILSLDYCYHLIYFYR